MARIRLAVTVLVAGAALVAAPMSAQARALPVNYDFAAGALAGFLFPQTPPPGADNFGCKPSSAHPDPVVLVNGTFGNQDDNWQAASPLLANHGYCVFTRRLGGRPPGHSARGCLRISTRTRPRRAPATAGAGRQFRRGLAGTAVTWIPRRRSGTRADLTDRITRTGCAGNIVSDAHLADAALSTGWKSARQRRGFGGSADGPLEYTPVAPAYRSPGLRRLVD